MNALPEAIADTTLYYERMDDSHLDEVMAIENDVYPFPWSRNVFSGALVVEDYECWVARDVVGLLVGYFVLLKVVDEAHLLTIAVRGHLHGHGIGRKLMRRLVDMARDEMKVESLLLEVRPSNLRALELYERTGFREIGRRKNYYQAAFAAREDAIVMRLPL